MQMQGSTKWVYDGVCRRRIHRDKCETVQVAAGTDKMDVQMVQGGCRIC